MTVAHAARNLRVACQRRLWIIVVLEQSVPRRRLSACHSAADGVPRHMFGS